MSLLQSVTATLGVLLVAGPLLSLTQHPHWFIRGWDFPRLQTAGFALGIGLLHAYVARPWGWFDLALLLGLTWSCLHQVYRILPYTLVWPKHVKRTAVGDPAGRLRLFVCNVQMKNRQYEQVVRMIRQEDPDVALLLEVDQAWADHLAELEYPHQYVRPQGNCYGMMLLTRLEPIDVRFRTIVKEDIPSVHAMLRLPGGQPFLLYGLHPEPPEPVRGQSAAARDAELVAVGREVRDRDRPDLPVIVAGDLNDVAWSSTTRLFLSVSQLLDPRRGRGLYNTYNANSWFWHFPLDHVFHSNSFQLIDLRVLGHVGSDHYPVLVDLQYRPEDRAEQPKPTTSSEDRADAQTKIDRQEQESHKEIESSKRQDRT